MVTNRPQYIANDTDVRKGAEISACGKYRYSLWRVWDDINPWVHFIGLNPSTADAVLDDPTIRRCINYAKDWGYGALSMCNLFAYRATDPKDMKRADDPIGPKNNVYLQTIGDSPELVIAAWGAHGNYLGRDKEVMELMPDLHILALTKHGMPRHPLYLKRDLVPALWADKNV
jgi:hypothetical protein